MVACMFQVKRFYCEADYNFYNHLALTPQEYQRTPGGGEVPWDIKSPGNVMNCPATNEKNCWSTPLRGGGFPGELGGSTFQKSGKCHELPRKLIHFCLPHPPTCLPHPPPHPYPTGGGGLGVKIGGTDGREGGMWWQLWSWPSAYGMEWVHNTNREPERSRVTS